MILFIVGRGATYMSKNRHALCILLLFATPQIAIAQYPATNAISAPTVFAPGMISTGDYEVCPQFSLDGKTLYFVKSTPDATFWTIVSSRFENGRWSSPEVAPFSGQYSDADEFITRDGAHMFFISNRPLPHTPNREPRQLDIWVMDKTANGWGEPRNLGPPVNSEEAEYFPTLANDGTLYFGSGRGGGKGGIDLYRSRFVSGKYQEPENLGDAINTTFDEFEPYIAPDQSFLIFMASRRPDGLGGFDLYISYNRNGQWTKAKNLGAQINSAAHELSPRITFDGKYFFWASARSTIDKPKSKSWDIAELSKAYHGPGNGLGDIYYIDLSKLPVSGSNPP
jgi:hypothetical protein